jgi:polysaccharide pyruvyl transferase WcaK-like protein
MSELFRVRDAAALRYCAGTKARLTDDLVFGWSELAPLGPPRTPRATARDGSRTIALAVYPPAFQGFAEQRAIAEFCAAIRAWHSHGHRIVFLVFQRAGVVPGDQVMFERIAAQLGPEVLVEIRTTAASPQAIATSYAGVDILCSMRFHGLVLASLLGIPFVGVTHDNKISEICRRFDMTCVDARAFDGAALADITESLLERRPDPRLLECSIGRARENFCALAGLMN